MQKIILANWKAELSPDRGHQWLDSFLARYQSRPDREVVLAVPCLLLEPVGERLRDVEGISLAAQAVSPYPPGRYTGALPAAWLGGLASYALVAHRERRRYFHESVQENAAQVRECLAAGITPILCVDEDLVAPIRAALDQAELDGIVVAWTPDSAVALEVMVSADGLAKGIARVQGYFPDRPLLYGGGVNPDNMAALLARDDLAGVMLGRGCLDGAALARGVG